MDQTHFAPCELTDCPDWGKGGSYALDPVTGVRTLIERGGELPVGATDPAPAADPFLTEEH